MNLLALALLLAPGPPAFCTDAGATDVVATPDARSIVAATPVRADTTMVRLYEEEGVAFDAFLASIDPQARPELWQANHAAGVSDAALLERARAVPGSWRILAVAVDACSDSVHTLPYIAALAAALDNVELRVVHPDAGGRSVMEAHPTPDERAATPTFVVLDAEGSEAGCWIERPTPLQAFMLSDDGRSRMEKFRMKMAWYEADAGWTTAGEFVEVLEGAAAGTPVCRRPVPADATYPAAGPEGRPVGGGEGPWPL